MRHRATAAALLGGLVLVAGCGGSDAPDGSAAASGSSAVMTGTTFTDPDKTYTISVGKGWTKAAAPAQGIEAWAVAQPAGGFAANVNVLTQAAPGLDLKGYLDASLANMGKATVVKQELVSTDGHRLGLLEYTQTMPAGGADRALHFLASFDVAGGHAVVATFTAEEPAFAGLRPTVEPYLRTLKAT